jgi:dihydropteroate synthase
MGVINVTPDSFSDGGDFITLAQVKTQTENMLEGGVDIIDVGGESSRPFSQPIPLEVEIKRVIPSIKQIRKITDIPVSVDTTKAEVARMAFEAGADIINDISALRFDPRMVETASHFNAPVILMHMKGSPKDMQEKPRYENVVHEVKTFLRERAEWAMNKGIPRDHIIIDPGIGFGKRVQDNLMLLKNLGSFSELDLPILVGPSRKSFLGEITGIENPRERDIATLSAISVSAMNGANIVRVHEVENSNQVIKVVNAIMKIQPC